MPGGPGPTVSSSIETPKKKYVYSFFFSPCQLEHNRCRADTICFHLYSTLCHTVLIFQANLNTHHTHTHTQRIKTGTTHLALTLIPTDPLCDIHVQEKKKLCSREARGIKQHMWLVTYKIAHFAKRAGHSFRQKADVTHTPYFFFVLWYLRVFVALLTRGDK